MTLLSNCCKEEVIFHSNRKKNLIVAQCSLCNKFCTYEPEQRYTRRSWRSEDAFTDEPDDM